MFSRTSQGDSQLIWLLTVAVKQSAVRSGKCKTLTGLVEFIFTLMLSSTPKERLLIKTATSKGKGTHEFGITISDQNMELITVETAQKCPDAFFQCHNSIIFASWF